MIIALHLSRFRLSALAMTLCLHACGGGSQQAGGVGSGGTGSYTNGPVSGLGSIIVNGVRYDVNSAQVQSDDGLSLSAADLKLGMVVEVQGSTAASNADGSGLDATATRVRTGSVLQGPVDALVPSAGLTVLGQAVKINPKTVLAGSYQQGSVVAVHGLVDASGQITATRIDTLPATTATRKLVGVVASLNASTMVVSMGQGGGVALSYRTLGGVPTGVVVGALVRVWFLPAGGASALPEISSLVLDSVLAQNTAQANVDGVLTKAPDVRGLAEVNGKPVDLSRTNSRSLLVGDRVRIEGSLVSGVVQASTVQTETDSEIDAEDVTLFGLPANVQSSAKTFVVHDTTVQYAAIQTDITAALGSSCVKVRGQAYNSLGQLLATSVVISTDCRR